MSGARSGRRADLTPLKLYGSPIDVVHLNGGIFVMAGCLHVERDAHLHAHPGRHVHV